MAVLDGGRSKVSGRSIAVEGAERLGHDLDLVRSEAFFTREATHAWPLSQTEGGNAWTSAVVTSSL